MDIRHLPPASDAVLVQPNLDVAADDVWVGPEWDRHIAQFRPAFTGGMQRLSGGDSGDGRAGEDRMRPNACVAKPA
jgi:hypothetical protein